MTTEQVSASHIGYVCDARKVAVVRDGQSARFAIQDMAIIDDAPLTNAAAQSFKTVHDGEVAYVETLMGRSGVCDFSAVTKPGIYRVVLPESGARSYHFAIADGVYHRLPSLFLDFMHDRRAGYYGDDLRRPLTVDDGVRSDTGAGWDATGGWYDAGDLRKWMATSTLPALGFLDVAEHLRLNRRAFDGPVAYPSDWLTETAWGLDFICRMQDPETGMIFEDVGGGGTARRVEGMSWWYENHAGCYADNADNRYTDNLPLSGDERAIRVQYNPIVQYTNLSILARGYAVCAPYDAGLSRRCHDAALAVWRFCQTRLDDDEHTWTSVRAWRLCAALELYRAGLLASESVEDAVGALLENFNNGLGFWANITGDPEPYRAILHSAQPLVALARYLDFVRDGAMVEAVRTVLALCKLNYVEPMTETNPYRFVPFGVYSRAATPDEVYRPWRDGRVLRFVMPVNHPQKINHGLSGHWMSWAHALAYVGQMLDDDTWTALAWAQIEWLTGSNPFDVSFISGVGYNNPMPHSRYLGTMIGGFMTGFRGTVEDMPAFDAARDAEWNSTEYWNVPLANCLMALARLLPPTVATARKLGASPNG